MKKILFFSNNNNKIGEVKKLLNQLSIEIFCPNDLNILYEPKEVGSSFAENAKIKSSFGFQRSQIPSFADDSGICIEALNWKPGISSRKFLSNFENENECFKYIFSKVQDTGKNKAYFKTSICLTTKFNYHIVFEGNIKGTISKCAKGKGGFGYDPIFIPSGYSQTFGEFSKIKKNNISHRSIAINKLMNFLAN